MLHWFLNYFAPESTLTNLFRYISFRSLAAAFFSFIFVMIFMPKLIAYLQKRAVGQVVRELGPKTHYQKAGTPTMGGLIMVLGILLSTLLFAPLDNPHIAISLFVMLSFGLIGFWDDFLKFTKKNTKGVSFRAKMLTLGFLSLVGVFLAVEWAGVEASIQVPFLKSFSIDIGLMFYVWGFFVLNGSSNAVNLTDGLDGLAIVPIMTTAFVLLVTSYVGGHTGFAEYLQFEYFPGSGELSVMMASVVGVGLGFLWFNSYPASIFMGDVGSLSLGGLLGIVALLTHKELVLLIAGFLFAIEAVSVMMQVGYYKRTKKRIFKMAPLHHHFELSGWPESKVIARFWIFSILCALVALTTLKIR